MLTMMQGTIVVVMLFPKPTMFKLIIKKDLNWLKVFRA